MNACASQTELSCKGHTPKRLANQKSRKEEKLLSDPDACTSEVKGSDHLVKLLFFISVFNVFSSSLILY